jgi:O-antigen/teichoic acid export membrane protein
MLKKIGFVAFAEIITKGAGYLLLPIFLSLMPKSEFGEFGFYFNTVPTVSLLVGLSLYVPFIKSYCSNSESTAKDEIITSIFISIFTVIVVFFLIAVPVGIISPELVVSFFGSEHYLTEKYWLFILLISTGVFSLYLYSLLIARNKTHEVYTYILLKFFLVSATSLVFIYLNISERDSVVDRLSAVLASEASLLAIYFFYTVRGSLKAKVNWDYLIRQMRVALPLIPLGIIGIFSILIDRKFILEYHGLSELASYNLALQLLIPVSMLMSSVQTVWSPHLYSIDNTYNAFKKTLFTMKIALIFMIFGVILIWVVIKVSLLYGIINMEYNEVLVIMSYVSLGIIAMALSQLCNNMFVYLNKTSLQLYVAILVVILLFLMSYIFIPDYGSVGGAISISISNIFGLLVSLLILKKMCKFNKRRCGG